MALVVYWYDFICFAIIATSIFISICIIWQKEGSTTRKSDDKSTYESLLLSHQSAGDDGCVGATSSGILSSTQLWTSCWRGVHPMWLMVTRLVSAVSMAGILAWDIERYDKTIFVYYTEWTFSLTIFYFVLASIVSACGLMENSKESTTDMGETNTVLKREPQWSKSTTSTATFAAIKYEDFIEVQQSNHEQAEIAPGTGFWGYLMQVIYQTCAGAVILTDFVFWIVIVPFLSITHFSLSLLMACMHTVNAVFLLVETALNSFPFPSFRLAYLVLWSSIYIVVQWILQACGFPWWPYPFLELDTRWAPLWYFCLAMIHFPCYGLYALIVKLKYSLFPKWFPHALTDSLAIV